MAGSLSHIVAPDGSFRMDLIENMGDAREALEECHQVIAYLSHAIASKDAEHGITAYGLVGACCECLAFPLPAAPPLIQPELTGAESVYNRDRKTNAN